MQWLREHGSERFFCWVHFFDPHSPYYPHRDLFGDRFAARPYDGGIAFMDRCVGRVLDALREAGVEDRTLVMAVGDHGESLPERPREPVPYHGYMLYEDTLRVPFIAALPGGAGGGGRRDPATVSLLDVLPTALGAVGLPPPAGARGRDLSPALRRGAAAPALDAVYGETERPAFFGWSAQRCLIAEDWKYIRSARPELYRLDLDPLESTNLAPASAKAAADMERALAGIERSLQPRTAGSIALSREEKRRLESLGYVGAGESPAPLPGGQDLKDMKDMVAAVNMTYEARRLRGEGKSEEALALWRSVVGASPETPSFRNSMACALMDLGRTDEAIAEFAALRERFAAQGGHDALSDTDRSTYRAVVENLAQCLVRSARFADALTPAREVVALSPKSGDAHHLLSRVLLGANQPDEARREAAAAIGLAPANPNHLLLLAEIERDAGRRDRAAELARKALQVLDRRKALRPGDEAIKQEVRDRAERLMRD